MRSGREGESIVVVPSRPIDNPNEPAARAQALEERLLFLLLLLRQPRLRVIYVTSLAVDPSIIEYYLGLLAGVIPAHARARLSLLSARDGSARPLSAKLIERPRLIEEIRRLIPDPGLCHLVPYTATALERDLALLLGVPMYGADPRFLPLGTKTGCRRLFAEEEIQHPFGREDVDSLEAVVDGLAELRASRPTATDALVKLNEGVSGRGNASVDLRELPPSGSAGEREALVERVRSMSFEAETVEFDAYMAKLEADGGIVEQRILGAELRSPSVQVRVTPLGEVELLSTHDQMLGGPSGQRYLGCRFPADPAYADAITADAAKLGARLAREGVLGRFAIDFVSVCDDRGDWSSYAIELNLRKGGTTHPYLTLEFLTEGHYDPGSATFRCSGRQGEVPRRQRPRRVPDVQGPDKRGSVRRHRPPRASLRPRAPEGRRLSHDERAERTRRCRTRRGRRQSRGSGRDVPGRRVGAARRRAVDAGTEQAALGELGFGRLEQASAGG